MQVASAVRSSTPLPAFPFLMLGMSAAAAGLTSHPLPGRTMRLQRGREIYAEGDKADQLYKVVSGTVRTCRLLPDGRRLVAQFALSGELFGLDGVSHHRFFAEAVTDVVLVAFPRREINLWVDRDPAVAQSWQAYTLEKLAAAQDRFILLGRRTATERVAAFLLDLAERGQGSAGTVDLPMSRYDIADYLGLTAETVSRVLSTLRKKRIIADQGCHSLRILDQDALEDQADE
ncbi:helix-turn-helix domain-containing protein [Roseomonas chloroacetimidivorans]|uniref:helix-turn-helix domain-containing protein n=1 Tax=Roseomonas chloroacetimidivorans TaxID=1766656 RepID=UPI003C791930